MSSPGAAAEEAGRDAGPAGPDPFGPNSAEVVAYLEALPRLTGAEWRKVVAARRLASNVIKDPSALPVDAVRSMLQAVAGGGGPASDPVVALGSALAAPLEGRSDDEVLATWQASSALTRRRQMAALTFAAHYMPFATVIPLSASEPPAPAVDRFGRALRRLDAARWQALSRTWTLDREASAALLQAAVKCPTRPSEEAVALAALAVVARHLPGDAGWAAVKTVVHGSRVLACRDELGAELIEVLWAPLEEAIPLRSLDERRPAERPARPKRARAEPTPRPARKPAVRRGPPYGPNHADVTLFVKTVPALTAIQWLRVLDRRQLVAGITRERSSEPAPVVRASLAAIRGTRGLDHDARCRVFSAVERAGYALESRDHLSAEQAAEHYGAVAELVRLQEVDAASLPVRLAALGHDEWVRLSEVAPPVEASASGPLLNAGDAIADLLAERTDDEVAVTWNALAALVHRHRLSPIKFAVSFAPFASVVVVVKPRSLPPLVRRYLDAVGRLSAHQCHALASPWLLADDVSSVLSAAVGDGSARTAEEAAALTAVVTVPMRLTGDAGWAAAKTVAYGARVASIRARVSDQQFEALWKPIEPAIPIASLDAKPRSRS